jgi:hypothetical protein
MLCAAPNPSQRIAGAMSSWGECAERTLAARDGPPNRHPKDITPQQVSRLQNVFPNGVCDWSKPGVEQQPLAGTWQFF